MKKICSPSSEIDTFKIFGCKTIKVIQSYPLSKVELVTLKGERFILKSVPTFYDMQTKKQSYLSHNCKKTHIPKIHWIRKKEDRIYFLMDYIERKNKYIPNRVYIKTIDLFHKETTGLYNKHFPVYNYAVFQKEYLKIKKLLPYDLVLKVNKEIAGLEEIFNTQNSIVHGDWVRAQLIGSNSKYFILDFEMSFYGPSILDHAHFYLKNKTMLAKDLNLIKIDKKTFDKARLLEVLRKLGWFIWFMENKFTTYKFEKEINDHVIILNQLINKKLYL